MKATMIIMLAACLTGCTVSNYKLTERKALDSMKRLNEQGIITDSLYISGYKVIK